MGRQALRLASVLSVAAVAGVVQMLLNYAASGQWKWAEALSSVTSTFATAFILVILLERIEANRWESSRMANFYALAEGLDLAISGWSRPNGVAPPELGTKALSAGARKMAEELRAAAQAVRTSMDTRVPSEHEYALFTVAARSVQQYDFEGGRSRRLRALERLDLNAFQRAVSRDSSPSTEALIAQFSRQVSIALSSAYHTDAVIRERIARHAPDSFPGIVATRPWILYAEPLVVLSGLFYEDFPNWRPEKVADVGYFRRAFNAAYNEMLQLIRTMELIDVIVRDGEIGRRIDQSVALAYRSAVG
ncbi:hypothetical protein GCM10023321_37620 [Pseudonocardia eucalypti]|uniref:Uncharacterized protein n=1 Tax=Pseudonocardia eucalypti TaxID=648755 RepID=A0ABP9Q824_9PSEU|nr:hypothetical protein [Pseudonocardia eucalypti]